MQCKGKHLFSFSPLNVSFFYLKQSKPKDYDTHTMGRTPSPVNKARHPACCNLSVLTAMQTDLSVTSPCTLQNEPHPLPDSLHLS